MLRKLLVVILALFISLGSAFAAVDVNSADQAALESVKGIGPVISKAIVAERAKGGPFKNADDLAARVKGIGSKSVVKLEQQGLTINGSSAPPANARAARTAGTAGTAMEATTGKAGMPGTADAGSTAAMKSTRSARSRPKSADAASAGTARMPARASAPGATRPANTASAIQGKQKSKRAAKADKAATASQ